MISKMKSEKSIYFDLMLTLTALAFIAYMYYGVRVIAVCAVSMLTCIISDYICIKFRGRRFAAEDTCSLSTGMIIALMMPASVSYNILILTCFISIIIGKHVFGGRKNLIFPPAATGFVFAVLSWKGEVMMYPKPYAEIGLGSAAPDTLVTSLSNMINITGTADVSDTDLMLGAFSGPMGATSLVVLAVCAAVLIFRRSISIMTFLGIIGVNAFYSLVFSTGDSAIKSLLYMLIGNMLVFGSIYIASDVRITPKSSVARLVYGIVMGFFICYLTRKCHLENAVIYAVLIVSPLAMALDDYTERVKKSFNKFYMSRIHPHISRIKSQLREKIGSGAETGKTNIN